MPKKEYDTRLGNVAQKPRIIWDNVKIIARNWKYSTRIITRRLFQPISCHNTKQTQMAKGLPTFTTHLPRLILPRPGNPKSCGFHFFRPSGLHCGFSNSPDNHQPSSKTGASVGHPTRTGAHCPTPAVVYNTQSFLW